MNGFIKRYGAVLCVACLLLTGCGDSMYSLTSEEESMIVAYSSGAVAKANMRQAQGMTYVIPKEEEQESQNGDAGTEPVNDMDTGTEPVNGMDAGESTDTKPAGSTAATLTEALNIGGIEAVYKGYHTSDNYTEGNYAALEAEEGHTYIILDIILTNNMAEPVKCDIFTTNPSCQIVVNKEAKAASLPTILLNDFFTYMETIEGGDSEETVMIFQVKPEDVENIESLALKFGLGGMEYNIALE